MMSRGVMWFLLLLMPVMVASTSYLSEPPQNGTRWELLEAVADQIHLQDGLMIRGSESLTYYLWNCYKKEPRSQRLEIAMDMSEHLKEIAFWERRIDMIGLIIFGPEKGPSFLSIRYDELPEPVDVSDHVRCRRTTYGLLEKHCAPPCLKGFRHAHTITNLCYLTSTAAIEKAIILTCGMNVIEPVPEQQVPYGYLALGSGLSFMAPFASKKSLDQYAADDGVARLLNWTMRALVVTTISLVSFVGSSSVMVAAASCLALALNYVIGSIIAPLLFKKTELPWEKFTDGWTRDQVTEWVSTPGFKEWMINNYHRIIVSPDTSQVVGDQVIKWVSTPIQRVDDQELPHNHNLSIYHLGCSPVAKELLNIREVTGSIPTGGKH